MSIDERLEALIQSLELMSHRQQDTDLRAAQAEERTAQFERELASVKERQTRLDDAMIVQAELMARLDHRVDHFVASTDDFVASTKEWINSAENPLAELQVLARTSLERLDKLENR